MVHALLGRKLEMTQLFTEGGDVIPVTVVEAGPCYITALMTPERNGYSAYQLGFEKSSKDVGKPRRGHFIKAQVPPLRHLREIRVEADADLGLEPGAMVTAGDVFAEGDIVDITGTTKGRGFAGTIKRHGFSRGPMTHGSMNRRRPGSVGQAADPAKVLKGVRMCGHMGSVRQTVKNLKVVRVVPEDNLLFIKGAIPGPNGGLVLVRDAKTGTSDAQRKRPIAVGAATEAEAE